MKKNKMMRIASVLLVAVLLSTCAISGTFAKFITTDTKSTTATVAKWDVNVTEAGESTFAFDLFETINDTKDSNDEADVADTKIAPGTEGSFAINLTSASEVSVKYTVDYTVTKNGVPIQFSVDNGNTWTEDLADVTDTLDVNETLNETITVMWKWDFGESVVDNDHSEKTVTVAVTVTFEQVD